MNKKTLMMVIACLGILGAQPAMAVGPTIFASIGLIGPNGEVISYEKEGDSIRLRVCAKNTLKDEIESGFGCKLADGTSEVVLSEKDFRGLISVSLGKIPPPQAVIENCIDGETDLHQVAVGFKCRTANGSIYERVARANFGEAWKGPDGLIWSDYVGSYSQYNAVKACKSIGGTLPARADFERGEANGFRELLPNIKVRWFWSSSVNPYDPYDAYVFNGYDGIFYNDDRDYTYSVRCVAR
jgi:hypothetical protein